ncbi:tRNA-dihydrouridine synthase family protein [uncultured Sunxiuqinia sp.]|uniref:tRNA-dihydrouridine synthase family protein n=1 Tax=uncultured Sunxiuqinia sp. TaxID=1573825 RepID=UPI002AA717BA|nr:tRNA-dihydrouridine synthase family protein [uncultured Sunxiuqinia sp.]
MSEQDSFYLAPLQGFTDFVYRRCYHEIFGSIDEYYIPYIAIGPGQKIRNSQYRDVLPENNESVPAVPQILCAHVGELKVLADELKQMDYTKINLNLGCPYPMATKRGRGTALLDNSDQLKRVLDCLFAEYDFKVSVKFRAGLTDESTIINRVELLQAYPFEKLIFHPRTAKQLYKGSANRQLFVKLAAQSKSPLVYNGDIQSIDDLNEIRQQIPNQDEWMIGRGILNDPFLPAKLKGKLHSDEAKLKKLITFHNEILKNYQSVWTDEGIVIHRMIQFWSYFQQSFIQGRKAYKVAKKARNLDNYQSRIDSFWVNAKLE